MPDLPNLLSLDSFTAIEQLQQSGTPLEAAKNYHALVLLYIQQNP
jgi:hypothetical protein